MSWQGFVVAGYVLQALSRWNDITQNGVRIFINNLENAVVIMNDACRCGNKQEEYLRDRTLRHCRLCLWVMFQNSGINDGTIDAAVDAKLIEYDTAEFKWLNSVSVRMR